MILDCSHSLRDSMLEELQGKKKLLQKQAEGKKKMQAIGKVNVPSDSRHGDDSRMTYELLFLVPSELLD